MSFRTRLISFFVVIVLLPMIAVGVLVFRLISDSDQGKADARATGLATVAASRYQSAAATARADAQLLAHNPALISARSRVLARLATQGGLARIVVSRGGHTVADTGEATAIAPAVAHVSYQAGRAPSITLTVSEITATEYVRELTAPGVGVIVRSGDREVAGSLQAPQSFPPAANVQVAGTRYREITQRFAGFAGAPVSVTVLSSLAATATTSNSSRALAIVFTVGFLLLALAFAVLSSRALQAQLNRFLHAARRLATGDFSAPVPKEGNDEFAALADEFNHMSQQLDRRLEELSQERARLRESVRRIGQTFASNLDRPALLELALETAIDGTQSDCGRVSVRPEPDQPLSRAAHAGSLDGSADSFDAAEAAALESETLGRVPDGDLDVLAVPLAPLRRGGRAHGLITVGRRGRPFSEDEADLLGTLAGQTALALENIDLHLQVSRQAVTDELTGLANHGRFQELLANEAEQVRRYHHSLGLIMIDLDNFKSVNDTYGHPQGDVVLRHAGAVLRENSRDADHPARYGGEELALILPHTDLEGAYAIAERIRAAIAELRVPRTDGGEPLRVTASVGVAASNEGNQDALIAEADGALYEAKRQGKNRTIRVPSQPANVVGAE